MSDLSHFWWQAGDDGPDFGLIGNSLRFRGGQHLAWTPSSAPSGTKWTISFWYKPGKLDTSYWPVIYSSNNQYSEVYIPPANATNYPNSPAFSTGTSPQIVSVMTRPGRDPSVWYHVVWAWDTTQASASKRSRYWINGKEIPISDVLYNGAQPGQGAHSNTMGGQTPRKIGSMNGSGQNFDGYLAEMHYVDGTGLTATDFGEFNAEGVWVPKKVTGLTYGKQGWYLDFKDPHNIGADRSGNGHNWTASGFELTNTTSHLYDWMADSPTNNYATGLPLLGQYNTGSTTNNYSDANSTFSMESTTRTQLWTQVFAPGGKYYVEWTTSNNSPHMGVCPGPYTLVNEANGIISIGEEGSNSWVHIDNYAKYPGGYKVAVTNQATNGTIGMTVDTTSWPTFKVQFYGNNGSPLGVERTNTAVSPKETLMPYQGGNGGGTFYLNAGQRPFIHTPPAGFKPLSTAGLSDVPIKNPREHFRAVIYTGNGSTQSITGVGFAPDFVWIKLRSQATNHVLQDRVRGATAYLNSNSTQPENTNTQVNFFSSFDSDGFTVRYTAANGASYWETNLSGNTYVAWCWKAGGAPVTNNAGSISSQVSANPTAGFSIVTYAGNNNANATVGHGLGVSPGLVIVKDRSTSNYVWMVKFATLGGNILELNGTGAANAPSSYSTGTIGTLNSTTFGFTTNGGMQAVNGTGQNYVAYCFAEVKGFSKFGQYSGNSSTDGVFVPTGFRPAFVMCKNTQGGSWFMHDTTRMPYNPAPNELLANSSNAEGSSYPLDILSNGFKWRSASGEVNTGPLYVFAAFAEHPFGGANVSPSPAR